MLSSDLTVEELIKFLQQELASGRVDPQTVIEIKYTTATTVKLYERKIPYQNKARISFVRRVVIL